jgi:hypothetical protein
MARAQRNPERERLEQADRGEAAWRRFGAYLSERQGGTVREDEVVATLAHELAGVRHG